MVDRTSTLTFVAKNAASGPINQIDRSLKGLGVTAGRTGSAFGGMGSILGGSAASFLGAGIAVGALAGFLGDATKAAIEDEASVKRLGASLQANVPNFDGNTAAIERWITRQQALGFSDDQLRSSMTVLAAATHDVGQAQTLAATAMDLARFKNIDLGAATEALVKIEGGQFRALKALGIELPKNATQTQALAAVQKVAAGQAAAFGETTAGALAEAGIAVDELKEKIGTGLAPVVREAAEGLSRLVSEDVPDFFANSAREIDALREAATPLAGMVDFLGGKLEELAHGARDTIGAARDLASISGGPLVTSAEAARQAALSAAKGIAAWTLREREATEAAKGLVTVTNTSTDALIEQAQKSLDAAAAQKELRKWLDFASDSASEANNNLLDFASGANTAANDANTASAAARALQRSLAAIERNIRVDIAYRISTAPFFNPRALPGTADADRRNAFSSGGDQAALDQANAGFLLRDRIAKDAAAAAKATADKLAGAHTGVGRAATEAARVVGSAFTNAKAGSDRWFKTIYDGNLKAIKQAHDRATAEIAAERRSVNARLTERKRLNAEPVTAAEQALAGVERGQQERNLRERLGEAQAGTFNAETGSFDIDQRAVRDASEALSSFLAQVDIDRLRVEQATADALADLDAVNANNALDKRQVAADRTEKLAIAAEDKRFKVEETAYAKRETALETHLGKIKASHSRVMREINDLYADFGIGSRAKAGGGGVSIAPGAIVISGVTDPDEVARVVMAAIQRERLRQNMSFA